MPNNSETTPRDRSEDANRSKQQQNPSQAGNIDTSTDKQSGSSNRSDSDKSGKGSKRTGQPVGQ